MDNITGVGVLDKVVALLDAAAASPAGLSALVEETGIARPTAHRLAQAMAAHGLFAKDDSGRYLPGPRLAGWTAAAADPLVLAASPVLQRLTDSTGESSQVYRRQGEHRLCVATAERPSGLRDSVPPGAVLPMTAGSAAQVLLAWADEAAVTSLLPGAAFGERELAAVRRRGWAASVAEREAGVASVSAPVLGPGGHVLAAISVSGPIERLGRAPGREHAAAVMAAGEELAATIR